MMLGEYFSLGMDETQIDAATTIPTITVTITTNGDDDHSHDSLLTYCVPDCKMLFLHYLVLSHKNPESELFL